MLGEYRHRLLFPGQPILSHPFPPFPSVSLLSGGLLVPIRSIVLHLLLPSPVLRDPPSGLHFLCSRVLLLPTSRHLPLLDLNRESQRSACLEAIHSNPHPGTIVPLPCPIFGTSLRRRVCFLLSEGLPLFDASLEIDSIDFIDGGCSDITFPA